MNDRKTRQNSKWVRLLIITLGTCIMGAGVNLMYEPMNMVVGGVSGLSIVVKKVTEGEQTIEYETQTGGTTTNSSSTNLNSIPISILGRLARYKRNKVCLRYD